MAVAKHKSKAPKKPGIRTAKSSTLPGEVIGQRLDLITRPAFEKEVFKDKDIPKGRSKKKIKTIGILTSGGDGPGENSAIASLVRWATQEHGWRVLGISDGFKGLLDPQNRILEIDFTDIDGKPAIKKARQTLYMSDQLNSRDGLPGIYGLGGNILKSSRTNPIESDHKGNYNADKVKETLNDYAIDALVILGGDGTLRAANDLTRFGVDLVFVPQSIDSDVPTSVTSIGFPSSVNRGASEIQGFLNTAQSCGRWFLVEVMGQRYGMLTLGIGVNAKLGRYLEYPKHMGPPVRVDSIFTEIPRTMSEVPDLIRYRKGFGQDHGVLLISEGVVFEGSEPPRETNAYNRMLIEAGDVSRWLRQRLLTRHDLRNTRSVSLGYSLRGAWPTAHEIALADRLSKSALELLAQGCFGLGVGLDFTGNTGRWTLVFPKISEAIKKPVKMNPEYLNYVQRLLEGR